MRGEPHVVAAPHVPDECLDFLGDGRTARFAALTQASPVVSEPFLLPSQHGTGLHEFQGRVASPTIAETAKPKRVGQQAGACGRLTLC